MKYLMRAALWAAFLFLPVVCLGQGAVLQSGLVNPQHAACWAMNGIIYDCGASTGQYIQTQGGTGSNTGLTNPSIVGGTISGAAISGGSISNVILSAPASTTASAGLILNPGVAPTSPVNGSLWVTSGGLYAQVAGVTVGPIGESTGGTVTSVSGGAANGLTINVSNGTTTPTITAQLNGLTGWLFGNGAAVSAGTLTANSVLGTLGSTAPGALSMPSCSSSTNALIWTTNSGFGCNNISGGGGGTNLGSLPSITSFDAACGVGTHDCASAFAAAVTSGHGVYWPAGLYYMTCNQTIGVPGFQVSGSGQATYSASTYSSGNSSGTLIVCTNPSTAFATVTAGTNWVGFSNFTLTRSITATAGGNGIVFQGETEFSTIDSVLLDSQYVNLVLKTTNYSLLSNFTGQNSVSDCIAMSNTSVMEQVQWSFFNVGCSKAGGAAYKLNAVSGVAGMIMGQWVKVSSFADTLGGINAVGISGTPIYDMTITGAFLGSDGNNSEINLIYVSKSTLSNFTLERAGLDSTGPNVGTGPSNLGAGVVVDANSSTNTFNNFYINTNADDGFDTSGTNIVINGAVVLDNGQAGTSGAKTGVNVKAGNATLTNVTSGNSAGGSAQQYGVFNSGTIDLLAAYNLLSNNTTAAYGGTNPTSVCGIGYVCSGGGGSVTSVAMSGGSTGLTFSGGPITGSGTFTAGGTLAVANGGTGATGAGGALSNLGAAPLSSPTFTGTVTIPTGNAIAGVAGTGAASAGNIGEYLTPVSVASTAPVSIASSGNTVNVGSISIPSGGEFYCSGSLGFVAANSTTVGTFVGGISLVSATVPTDPGGNGKFIATSPSSATFTGGTYQWGLGTVRISTSGSTTVFLTAFATYGISTIGAFGSMSCWRGSAG